MEIRENVIKENYRAIPFMSTEENILNKIVANQVQQYLCLSWVHFRNGKVTSEGILKFFDMTTLRD